ncbi:MAG: acyloxyacyl hydrolase [Motiliproteus sp.]|nr:acyloxyacyl hydrolase [Motiliproteus sp.]
MNSKPLLAVLALSAAAFAAPAQAVDGFTVNVGSSDDDINFYRVGARFDWDQKWFEEGNWFLGGRFELGLTYLDSDSDVVNTTGAEDSAYGISFTPVLRYQRKPYSNGVAPFVEAGIGLAYLSEDKLENESSTGTDLGGNIQFEDIISVGVMFGEQQRYELSANYFHYSNAGLEEPNDGIDIYSVTFSMKY